MGGAGGAQREPGSSQSPRSSGTEGGGVAPAPPHPRQTPACQAEGGRDLSLLRPEQPGSLWPPVRPHLPLRPLSEVAHEVLLPHEQVHEAREGGGDCVQKRGGPCVSLADAETCRARATPAPGTARSLWAAEPSRGPGCRPWAGANSGHGPGHRAFPPEGFSCPPPFLFPGVAARAAVLVGGRGTGRLEP